MAMDNGGVFLEKPTMELQDEYTSFYHEWRESGEEFVPWVIERDITDFQGMLQFLLDSERGEGLPEGWVPSSTYWLVNQDGRVLGAVNIRHGLTQSLLESGGHIGYGIRPSERRKGYATRILALSLEKAKVLGIQRALVVCDATNIGSEKTILKNGGVQDESYVTKDGGVIHRFWIEV